MAPIRTVDAVVPYTIYVSDNALYNFVFGATNGTGTAKVPPKAMIDLLQLTLGINYNANGAFDINTARTNNLKVWMTIDGYGPASSTTGETSNVFAAPPGGYAVYGYEDVFSDPPIGILPWDVLGQQFLIPGSPDGYFNTVNLELVWSMSVTFVTFQPNEPGVTLPAIPQRRWTMGFEMPGLEGNSSPVNGISRDASRVSDGLGWTIRNTTNQTITKAVNEFRPLFTTSISWERFYVRIRLIGITKIDIWKTVGSPSGGNGIRLYINIDGTISCYNVNSSFVETLLATSTISADVDTWYKLDCYVTYNSAGSGGGGLFLLYIDGELIFYELVAAASGGIGSNGSSHAQTVLGTSIASTNHGWELDFDDWFDADVPSSLDTIDTVLGSHIRRTWIDGATLTNWAGNFESLNQVINPQNASTTALVTCSTALSEIIAVTEVSDINTDIGLNFGVTCFLVATFNAIASGTTSGQLGYSLAGGSPVLGNITESSSGAQRSVMYIGDGISTFPPIITPVNIIYVKANTSVKATIFGMSAVIEYVGAWGNEDGITNLIPRTSSIHNCWYPSYPAAFTTPPISGYSGSVGGTYTGNGTAQIVILPLPACFIWIRPLTGGSGGAKWMATNLGGHVSTKQGITPDFLVRPFFDPSSLEAGFIVTGDDANINASGVTYQYVAFCDPTQLFNLCGTFIHSTGLSVVNNPLFNPGFFPEAAFFSQDTFDTSTNIGMYFKGAGDASGSVSKMDGSGTQTSNFADFALGSIISETNAHNSGQGPQMAYSAWRTTDNCASNQVQIFSYIGDGNSSRVINCTPISGKYPLLAYVQPLDGHIGFWRDPSDIGTSSRQITDGSASSTAITAGGLDTITVGTTLNTLNHVYNVFIITGDTLGWNNGEFFITVCEPYSPMVIPDPIEGINILPQGGIILDGDTSKTLLKNISGIYTLIPGQTHDVLYDRQTGQTSVDVAIPNPNFKTGYIGG